MLCLVFLTSICLLTVSTTHQETCDDEIAREQKEDWKLHSCRSCKVLTVDSSANCPQTGYDCDPSLPMTSNVLRDGCECAQLHCVDNNATLAVGGALTGKVRCVDNKWMTRTDDVAVSGVCARKCGLGVCKILPDDFFTDKPLYGPFVPSPPDGEHACAWGKCQYGAVGSSGSTTIPYEGPAEFSCSGDGRWKGVDEKKHDHIMCSVAVPCKQLVTWNANECRLNGGGSTPCYDPIESSTTAFVCPTRRDIVFWDSRNSALLTLDSAKCVNGGWVYDMTSEMSEPTVYTQAQFDDFYLKEDQKFSCY